MWDDVKQTTTKTYYANQQLTTLTTKDRGGAVVESHDLAYTDAGGNYAVTAPATPTASTTPTPPRAPPPPALLALEEISTDKADRAETETKAYLYDVLGRRITLDHDKATTLDAGGTTSEEARYTYGHDPQTSVSLLLDDGTGSQGPNAASVKATYGYTPYGNPDDELTKGDVQPLEPINPFRFIGKYHDPATGTVDMGARRYNPNVGRFMQRDRYYGALSDLSLTTDPLTANRYAYAAGRPIGYIETDGHRPDSWSGETSSPRDWHPDYRDHRETTSGDTCAKTLECSISDFNQMPVAEREEFVEEFQLRYGADYNIDDWFSNIEGLLRFLRDEGESMPGSWASWVDASILHGFQRGMAIVEGVGGSMGNPGAVKWATFFNYSAINRGDSDEKRRLWSEAEQASTEHGYAVARKGASASMPEAALALGGEAYRFGLRHMRVVRVGAGVAGGQLCGPMCARLGAQATQDFLSPKIPEPSYYGGHIFHGYGEYVQGVLTVDPGVAASGLHEMGTYGVQGSYEALQWLGNHL